MNILRKTLLVLVTPLFSLLLFTTALDFGIVHFAGTPTPVKKLLADSGIYNNVIPHALDNIKQASGEGGSVSLSDPVVKNAADKALSPQIIQQSTNQIIDGVYHWLDGKTALPDFRVDLSGAKTSFATLVGQAAEQKTASLPACASGISGVSDSFDPFSAVCLPAGISAAQAGAKARDTLISGKGFLDDPVISAASLKSSNNNQSVFADKQNVPKQFQRAKKSPVILVLLTILVGGIIVLLSSSWQKGLRHVGFTLLFIGAFMLTFAWALNWAVDSKVLPKLNINNAALAGDIKTLIRDVVQAIDKNYWLFGAVYAVLGAGVLTGPMAYARFGGRRLRTNPPVSQTSQPAPQKAEPAKKPKKI